MGIECCHIALLHYPVYNKRGDVVTTAVTNMDIHDISRAAKTFGMRRFYVVTPIPEQQEFAAKILRHWQEGHGSVYNPSRKKAFDIVSLAPSLDEVIRRVESELTKPVRVAVTSAAPHHRLSTSYGDFKKAVLNGSEAWILVFGTGWGCAAEVIERADVILDPIQGPTGYNHLSVRSAVAIVLDRLWGERQKNDHTGRGVTTTDAENELHE